MFYIWIESGVGPKRIVDAGSTLFSSDATEDDFGDYAKSRGFTVEGDRKAGCRAWRTPNGESWLSVVGVEDDSARAARIAGYIKLAGRIVR